MRNLELVGGVPWAMNKEKDPEGEEMKHEVVKMDKDYKEIMREMSQEDEVVPRRAGFSQKDLETHGFTMGCAGCKSVLTGGRRQGHSEECRRRLEKEMAGEDKVRRAAERRD